MVSGHVTIGSVEPLRGAAAVGIMPRNRILRVAGIPVTSDPGALDRVKGLLTGQSRTQVTLVIEYYSEGRWNLRKCAVKRG